MLKLNNKGMTTVEILVSFILVAVISTSLYTTVSNYARKLERESNKLEINTYKNVLTKEIQDDIIKKGLINAQIKEFHNPLGAAVSDPKHPIDIFVVDLEFKDHSIKRLAVYRKLAEYYIAEESSTESSQENDDFKIYYGKPNNVFAYMTNSNYMKGLEEFPIPDLGEGENDLGHTVKDLRLTNVIIKNENKVLSIFLGFQHIDEGTKYAINIVSPIDFQS